MKRTLLKHHKMKAIRGVEVELYVFITSKLDGGEWLASCPGRFTAKERLHDVHRIGSCVRPRAGLDEVAKQILSLPLPEIEPQWSGS
jgi:hypothetical protein